jgi:hypothetical protein
MRVPRSALAAFVSCTLAGSAAAMPVRHFPAQDNSLVQKAAWVCDATHCWSQPGPAPGPGQGPSPAQGPGPEPSQGPGPEGPGPGRPGPGAGPGPGFANQNGPCARIRAACLRAGFVPGGARAGIGLQIDCIRPIMQGAPQPARAVQPLPPIDPRIVAACRATNPRFGTGGPPGAAGGPPPPGGGEGPPGSNPAESGAPPPPGNPPQSGGPPPPGVNE